MSFGYFPRNVLRATTDAEITSIRAVFHYLRHNLRADDPLRPLVGGRKYNKQGDLVELAPLCRCGHRRSWNTARGEYKAYCDGCYREAEAARARKRWGEAGV